MSINYEGNIQHDTFANTSQCLLHVFHGVMRETRMVVGQSGQQELKSINHLRHLFGTPPGTFWFHLLTGAIFLTIMQKCI